jgi:ATP-dependent DNA helicase RecQ
MEKQKILKEYFGYRAFREGQEPVIDAIMAGRDALAVMPTGAGKSLCYQIPALMLDGLTVVISPLISLMKDQVNALRESGVAAAYLNSSLSESEYRETIAALNSGRCKMLYIAPERLLKENFQRVVNAVSIPLVVVDEAHCVSQWGHDFRPSYLQITEFIASLSRRPVIAAFTATATAKVKEDILSLLKLKSPFAITTGFDRKNLYFEIRRPKNKLTALLDYLRERKNKSGIVYCSTRKTVEELWERLCQRGFSVSKYHAGLDDEERHKNQDDFIYDRKTVMIATNAFGMGIDKSNVSFVIHYNMPKNIESYYQEAGRAGRDGERAECILFYSGNDVHINEFLIKHAEDGVETDNHLIQHNLELLKQMTFYAASTDCLRAKLLAYFGEAASSFCGACSNCNTLFEPADITIESQKIISCVLRLEQRNRRFGKTVIVDILRGSKTEKIRSFRLDTLSVYGIMKGLDGRRIRTIIDFLIEQGFLALENVESFTNTGASYAVVKSCARSGEIVFEKKRVQMMLPKEIKRTVKSAEAVSGGNGSGENAPFPFDEVLFEKLRDLRKNIAQNAGVPSYIVFSDAALREMCRKTPVNRSEFLRISGVGEIKMEKYGESFTGLIREHLEHRPAPSRL